MSIPVLHIAVTTALALQFVHYFGAGARTFSRPRLDHGGEAAGALFVVAGVGVFILARVQHIDRLNGAIALLLTAASLSLYEWARRTVRGRGFGVIFSEVVPERVCESGPYAFIRHPFYSSYVLGFTAGLVAFPNVFSALGWAVAVVWFSIGALHDEKVMAGSRLSNEYEGYRKRTGMFFPAVWK